MPLSTRAACRRFRRGRPTPIRAIRHGPDRRRLAGHDRGRGPGRHGGLRGGAGLVRLAVPDRCLDTVAGFEPSYMTVAAARRRRTAGSAARPIDADRRTGRSRPRSSPAGRAWAVRPTWIGSSRGSTRRLPKPMVFDADALNALAARARSRWPHPGGPRMLTPHPGEFARLVGRQAGRASSATTAAVELAGRCGVVVVLKGHRTLVTDGRRRAHQLPRATPAWPPAARATC